SATLFLPQPHGAHPDLPSFPTRRSSDLIAERHDRERFGRREHRAMAAPRMVGMAVGHHGARGRARRVDPQVGGLHIDAALMRLEDRKSTRLNSSHVKISYAVFCLKKKKK